jgi:hypothetical protein
MKQVLIALDHLANTLLAGHADETLSARDAAYSATVAGTAAVGIHHQKPATVVDTRWTP